MAPGAQLQKPLCLTAVRGSLPTAARAVFVPESRVLEVILFMNIVKDVAFFVGALFFTSVCGTNLIKLMFVNSTPGSFCFLPGVCNHKHTA